MARERIYDWPGGTLLVVSVVDLGGVLWEEPRGEWEAVPLGEGLALRQPLLYHLRDPEEKELAELEIGVVGGRAGCTAIRARGEALTGALLRSLPLGRIVREALRGETVRVTREAEGQVVGELYPDFPEGMLGFGDLRTELDDELETVAKPKHKRARRELTGDFLQEVAEVYRAAHARGHSTQRAIMDRFGPASPASARRWVWHARDRGFLGDAPRERVAGEVAKPIQPKEPERRSRP